MAMGSRSIPALALACLLALVTVANAQRLSEQPIGLMAQNVMHGMQTPPKRLSGYFSVRACW